ncbi:MAG: hypothetical protein NVS4B3_00210 [Gemmatimonadaceae bacterium]
MKSIPAGMMPMLIVMACNGGRTHAYPASRDSTVIRTSTAEMAVPLSYDAELVAADSALRRQLPLYLFHAAPRFAPGVKPCAADDNSESPPALIAAGRARIVGHDTTERQSFSEDGGPVKQTTFKVEVTSVARLEPASSTGWQGDTAITAHFEPYVAAVGVRSDTMTIAVLDLGPTAPTRWAVCDPVDLRHPTLGAFVRAGETWLKVVRWTPSTATWDDVRRLADSVATPL